MARSVRGSRVICRNIALVRYPTISVGQSDGCSILSQVGGKAMAEHSDYNNLPTPRIGNQLGADSLTGNQPILSGDVMDVGLWSVAIPVCHHVLTDRRMSDRIKRRGIDKEWQTEVYSMSDIDGLFERLERLR